VHSVEFRSINAQQAALDKLRRQLGDLYDLHTVPAAPSGDYTPNEWREWREAAQHAYGVREGLLIAMTVGAAVQTALGAQLRVPGPAPLRLAGADTR
jgi:hypothetical protein